MISLRQSELENSVSVLLEDSTEMVEIHSIFAETVSETLSGMFDTKIGVKLRSTEYSAMGVFRDRFLPKMPSNHLIKVNPLFRHAIIQFDAHLACRFVDLTFGGSGILDLKIGYEGVIRDYTPIEKQLIKQVVEKILVDLRQSWAADSQLTFIYDEFNNPDLYFKYLPDVPTRILRFDVKIAESYLSFNLYFPVIPRSKDLSSYIGNEHPQTIVWFIASLLTKEQAAYTLQNFPENLQADVISRLAILDQIHRQPVDGILKILSSDFSQQLESPKNVAINGLDKACEILSELPNNINLQIIATIKTSNLKLGEKLEKKS